MNSTLSFKRARRLLCKRRARREAGAVKRAARRNERHLNKMALKKSDSEEFIPAVKKADGRDII